MDVVTSIVQGSDDSVGVALALPIPALLGEYPVVRESFSEDLSALSIGFFVGLCNEVPLPFVPDLVYRRNCPAASRRPPP